MKELVFAALVSLQSVWAFDTEDVLHPVAHIGGAYAITHVTHVVCRRVSDRSELFCSLLGAGVALTAGIAVEATQSESVGSHSLGVAEDAIGIGLAMTMIHLEF